MIRIPVVVATCLAVGALVLGTAMSADAQTSGLTTTFRTDTNSSGAGYQATFTITNGTGAPVGQWAVAVILPSGAQVSDVTGPATVVVNGQVVTGRSQSLLDTGATATFGFMVQGGAAPPFPCVSNGVQCQPASPAPTPTPTPTPSTTPATTAPATTAPATTAPATTAPATTAPATTAPAQTPTPTPTPTPLPTTSPIA